MNKVIDNNGKKIKAQFKIATIDKQLGLTLESRNVKRNEDYNLALEIILNRLKDSNIRSIRIKVVSATLLKEMPNPFERTIEINGESNISLLNQDINQLRKQIGSAASKIKVDKKSKGGNPTKRIQLFADFLSEEDWNKIASGGILNQVTTLGEVFSLKQFEEKVNSFIKSPPKEIPKGKQNPQRKKAAATEIYERDAKVKAWVINNAKGKCECCKKDSPFISTNGTPYLEVHHLKQLAKGGSDTIENTVALCPNCHKEFHFGINKKKLLNKIYNSIQRIVRE